MLVCLVLVLAIHDLHLTVFVEGAIDVLAALQAVRSEVVREAVPFMSLLPRCKPSMGSCGQVPEHFSTWFNQLTTPDQDRLRLEG